MKVPFISDNVAKIQITTAAASTSGSSGVKFVDRLGRVKEAKNQVITDAVLKEAFEAAAKKYGTDKARTAEKMFRLETAHFKSGQFKKTFSPGQEIPDKIKSFPYGWTSMRKIWEENPELSPVGYVVMQENAGAQADKNVDRFIKYPSMKAAVFSICEYLNIYPAGRWYSTDFAKQGKYEEKLSKIKNKFI